MQHFFEDLFFIYSIPILAILFFTGIYYLIEKKISKSNLEVSIGRKITYFIPICLFIFVLTFLIFGIFNEKGLVGYLGDDPLSFIKHLFGF